MIFGLFLLNSHLQYHIADHNKLTQARIGEESKIEEANIASFTINNQDGQLANPDHYYTFNYRQFIHEWRIKEL